MKNLSKKGGISLVALVITIIVLIILTGAVIVTFMEGGIIDRAKEAVFKNDMRTYQEILALKRAENQMEIALGEKEAQEINASTLEEIQEIIPEFKEEYEGMVEVVDGVLVLGETEKETYSVWLAELGIEKGEKNSISFSKTSEGELAIGSEITASNGEVFYVIGFTDDNAKVNMIAKYNLGTDGKQDTTGASNPIVFCTGDAWTAASVANNDNLNDKEALQLDTTSAVYKAKVYGESLGTTGRLMLKDEAEALKTANSTILYGKYETGSYLNYWLGSANSTSIVWIVGGVGEFMQSIVYNTGSVYGVRPVITISESAVN